MTSADPAPSGASSPGSFADELRTLYDMRQRAEADIADALATRRQALSEADQIVAGAQDAAEALRADAATHASLASAEARGRAEQIIAEAESAARTILAEAESDAERLRRDAAVTSTRAEELETSATELIETARRMAEFEREASARETADLRTTALATVSAESNRALDQLDQVAASLNDAITAAAARLSDILAALSGARESIPRLDREDSADEGGHGYP
jgi:vacuolar-type H+-ATPase subunit H